MSKLKSKRPLAGWNGDWVDTLLPGVRTGQSSLINIEASNTIIQQSPLDGSIYTVDALTSGGWLRTLGIQVDERDRDRILRNLEMGQWNVPRATKVVSFASKGSTADAASDDLTREEPLTPAVTSDYSAEELLRFLEGTHTSIADRQNAILFAASKAFTVEQRPRLLSVLARYIEEHRFTDNEACLVVVGSAVRKYSMNMCERHFDDFSDWLSPSETTYLSEYLELEFIKGICWRLTYSPVQANIAFPRLAKTLLQIVEQYTNSRILLQKNFDAISLNAIVTVFLLDALESRSGKAARAWAHVENANLSWFTALVVRRLTATAKSIQPHDTKLELALQQLTNDICSTDEDS